MGNFFSNVERELKEWQEPYCDPTRGDLNVCLSIGDEEVIVLPIRNCEPVEWEPDCDPVDLWCMKNCMQYRFYLTHDHCE